MRQPSASPRGGQSCTLEAGEARHKRRTPRGSMSGATTTARARPAAGGFDPFRWSFRLLTSVRFALIQLGVLCVLALLGVLFPQAPPEIRFNPPAYDAWIEFQR